VVQRMQTLATLFIILALVAWLRFRLAQLRGVPGSHWGWLAMLAWVMALASKEDSILLPAYTLLLELTVLRFGAADPRTGRVWSRVYLVLVTMGALAYLLLVVPHYWSTGPYGGRDFSSLERLLTQGRVLTMYMGQILLPLPDNLTFYYDGYAVSRGLWSPPTTVFALLLVAGLLISAWILRSRSPLISFGILFYFCGHFVTSNVIPLELCGTGHWLRDRAPAGALACTATCHCSGCNGGHVGIGWRHGRTSQPLGQSRTACRRISPLGARLGACLAIEMRLPLRALPGR
jgi:hypothetical protein